MLALPVLLEPFDIYVFKDKVPGSNIEQVPAADVVVDFYEQGATLSGSLNQFVSASLGNVDVFHSGAIATGDSLRAHFYNQGDPDQPRTVDFEVASDVTLVTPVKIALKVTSPPGGYYLPPGTRLIRTTDRPKIYLDPTGVAATTDSFVRTSLSGRARCYLRPRRFDYLVTVDGEEFPRIFPDAVGSYVIA